MSIAVIVLIPLLGSALPVVVERLAVRWAGLVAAGVAALALICCLPVVLLVFTGHIPEQSYSWLPATGLAVTFRVDGLAVLFLLLVLGIGLLVLVYARYYLGKGSQVGWFYGYFLLFMGAMVGMVVSDNLLQLLVFWELTSLSSFLLIGYKQTDPEARTGALTALAVTGGGGLALLAGLLLLGEMAGTYQISELVQLGTVVREHDLYLPALILILLGAFTKSAQMPFHFWLPRAMAAPTPVSAYLHSATMVKAGVFLLARLFPVLSGTDPWFYLVSGTGLLTLVVGSYLALFQHDLKGLLAYSTISHLGLIVFLFGIDTRLSAVAAVFHIINHATFKASLFMAAGIIDHETGTRDMRRLNGLWRYMPQTATLAMVASAAMGGVPLLNGFLSKEMFFSQTLHLAGVGLWGTLVPACATLAGVFAIAYSTRFIHDVFFNGEPQGLPNYPPHEPPLFMRLPVAVLVLQCVLVGIFPEYTVAPFLQTAVGAVLATEPPAYSLAIWHGVNLPLLMSMVALGGGLGVYALRHRLYSAHRHFFLPLDVFELFQSFLTSFIRATQRASSWLVTGSLQRSLVLLLVAATGAMTLPLVQPLSLVDFSAMSSPDPLTAVAGLVLAGAALLTVRWSGDRFLMLIPLSVVGLMICLAFARFSAPDLVLTQLAVEIATILLFLLALYFLPQQEQYPLRGVWRVGALLLGLAVGGSVSLLALAMLQHPGVSISDYFVQNSLSGGGGANVVNVILVDFRGFDTLGEITVLAIAALGIAALLTKVQLVPGIQPLHRWIDLHPPLLTVIASLLLPLALLFSLYLFLRGHNAPGGGFVAGLVTALALILQYLAHGIGWAQARWRIQFVFLIGWGLLLSLLTGLGSWLFAKPFLTSAFTHLHLPVIGDFELATAMLFDVGVYMTVVGVVLMILSTLGGLSRNDGFTGTED